LGWANVAEDEVQFAVPAGEERRRGGRVGCEVWRSSDFVCGNARVWMNHRMRP
jgi:hypothetical protein